MEGIRDRIGDRFFQLSSLYGAQGWYFKVRGRNQTMGPYVSREMVEVVARQFAAERQNSRDSGGRG